jgi:electron transfer flavoprotein beta subunit
VKIAVCVKQVSASSEVQVDRRTGNLIRNSKDNMINPWDIYALETALALQVRYGHDCETYAISMGPPQADMALRECLAMGIEHAILLTDRKFAGSDTLATSYVLKNAIDKYVPDFDLILCGKSAIDSDTSIIGAGLAERYGIPSVCAVSSLKYFEDTKTIECEKTVGGDIVTVSCAAPAVVTVSDSPNSGAHMDIYKIAHAAKTEITVAGAAELGCEDKLIGKEGSPTSMDSMFEINTKGRARMLSDSRDENIKNVLKSVGVTVGSSGLE